MRYSVGLIGAGNIGLLFDYSRSKKTAFSHAKAIYLHKRFELKYIVDRNKLLFRKTKQLFPHAECLTDWKQLVNNQDIDVLVIALPLEFHFKCLKDFKKNRHIRIFFIEKPLFYTRDEYNLMDKRLQKKIVVNYVIRFEPAVISLKNKIARGMFKDPLKVVCRYTKGFGHNASHAVDLLNYIFNGLRFVEAKVLDKVVDYRRDDPTLDVFVKVSYKARTFPVYFIGADERKYSLFEVDILFENRRVEFTDFGRILKIHHIVADPEYPEYKMLTTNARVVRTASHFTMLHAYNMLAKMLDHKMENISSFQSEIDNLNFIDSIHKEICSV